MTIILIFISILAVVGTLNNKRSGNKSGFILSSMFTIATIGVTLLAIYDELVGIQ